MGYGHGLILGAAYLAVAVAAAMTVFLRSDVTAQLRHARASLWPG